ncbi:MAG: class I SAM-dependent methyltransferase, partial [Gemmatimonadota bacterium]|nr:class I SAM-dependent methyltransferase [Gemmatimonadota bacterium]
MSAERDNSDDFNYDSVADRYARRVDSAPYNAHYERPAMLATLDRLPSIRGRRVLDAGCGTGWYAAQLLARGARVAGIDGSKRMLSYARARFGRQTWGGGGGGAASDDGLLLAAGDLSSALPFRSASFEVVVSPLVLHYIRDWTPALSELARVLIPGGRLVFSTHHPAHEAQRLAADGFAVRYDEIQLVEEEWEEIGQVRFFRRSLMSITDALAEAGFVMERLVEPVPTDAFRAAKPEAYARLLERPEFLIVQARRDPDGVA